MQHRVGNYTEEKIASIKKKITCQYNFEIFENIGSTGRWVNLNAVALCNYSDTYPSSAVSEKCSKHPRCKERECR